MKAKAFPLTAVLLLTGGLSLIGWLVWNMYKPVVPPYDYILVKEGPVEEFKELGLFQLESPSVVVRLYELRALQEEQPLVVLHTARLNQAAPVLLDWHADFSEPLLNLATDVEETQALAKALQEHVPRDALLLAWWDLSRRLQLLAGVDVLFDRNLARPLMLPAAWSSYQPAIGSLENDFWETVEASEKDGLFGEFVEAMLSEKSAGLEKLKRLAGEHETYLVIDIRDAYKLGNLYPDRFGIGFKDFPKGSDVHGSAGSIKNWLREQGHEGYAVQPMSGNLLRVYFFTDSKSQHTLLANLLPFTTSNPVDLTEPGLVYQHKSFWVYRLINGGADN
ncbi:MAG: hydroxylamine oxidation protein HaoB [Gammaproteobacteria bacterium]|nr:hydroxylamine oxidation protein HaoB [Gammaproteobacteria bacterium]